MLDPSLLTPDQRAALLREAVYYSHVTRYSHVAAYSLFVYDWLLCLHEEINLIAQGGSWRGKIAYLFCRFWPLVTYPVTLWIQMNDHNPTKCEGLFQIPIFLTILNLIGAAGILILRIYAFTGGKRWVALFLGACLVTVATFQAYVAGARSALIPLPIGCYPVDNGAQKFLSGYFLSALLFDSVVTATFILFTLTKMNTSYGSMTEFTQMFIREGAFYFLAISAVNIINGYFNYQPNILMATVNVPMSLLLPNLLACRLVINLRTSRSGPDASFHPLSLNHSSSQQHSSSHTHGQSTSFVIGGTTFEVALEDMSHNTAQVSHGSNGAGDLESAKRPSTIKWAQGAGYGSVNVDSPGFDKTRFEASGSGSAGSSPSYTQTRFHTPSSQLSDGGQVPSRRPSLLSASSRTVVSAEEMSATMTVYDGAGRRGGSRSGRATPEELHKLGVPVV